MWLLTRLLFGPTLAWNALLCLISSRRQWWNVVDRGVILGALPIGRHVPRLKALGVTCVINLCEEWSGPTRMYQEHGISQLRLPTLDFHSPSLAHIQQGVEFINARIADGGTVYVHCNAGRGRSATVVLCWLMAALSMTPEEAQAFLTVCRPQISPTLHSRTVVQQFLQSSL